VCVKDGVQLQVTLVLVLPTLLVNLFKGFVRFSKNLD